MSSFGFSVLFVVFFVLTLGLRFWLATRHMRHVARHRAAVPPEAYGSAAAPKGSGRLCELLTSARQICIRPPPNAPPPPPETRADKLAGGLIFVSVAALLFCLRLRITAARLAIDSARPLRRPFNRRLLIMRRL